MFRVEQHRTEIHQATRQANRSPKNIRQGHCAALPWAGRALAATPDGVRQHSRGMVLGPGKQQAEQEPGHTETRAAEWHFLVIMSLKQWRKGPESLYSDCGFSRPILRKPSGSWSELVMDCFKHEVCLGTFRGSFQDELSHDSAVP